MKKNEKIRAFGWIKFEKSESTNELKIVSGLVEKFEKRCEIRKRERIFRFLRKKVNFHVSKMIHSSDVMRRKKAMLKFVRNDFFRNGV